MEVYRRITERVRGALWAHHRRLMPERQFQRILAYVYNNKYEYQMRFDKMEVVGKEWGGRVEVVTTPAGHVKRIRVNPCVEELPLPSRKQLILSAYGKACGEGRKLMQEAELRVYKQFLSDLKPIVLGIRDNPEFYTVPEGSVETIGGVMKPGTTEAEVTHRTIPFDKAFQPSHEHARRQRMQAMFLTTTDGAAWARSIVGKQFLERYAPHAGRQRGSPGAKVNAAPLELLAPYTPMDEGRLLRKNWMAYMDNKHVAETMWTRAKVADREKTLRILQGRGQAWHRPINREAVERW